jgi:hypothetical protein
MMLINRGSTTSSIDSRGGLNDGAIVSIENPSPRHRPSIFKGRRVLDLPSTFL